MVENGGERRRMKPEQISLNARDIKSSTLLAAIERDGINDGVDEKITEAETERICEAILEMQRRQYDDVRRNKYHNAEHASEVINRVKAIFARDNGIKPNVQRLIRIAAAFHDLGHSGKTLRKAADGLSNEEYAAVLADQWIVDTKIKLSVNQRVKLYALIIGTTFGNHAIKPETKAEQILAIADIGGFVNSWEWWVKESALVLKEISKSQRPKTMEEWLNGRLAFLDHIDARLAAVKGFNHGYYMKAAEKRKIVTELLAGRGAEYRDVIEKVIRPELNANS